MDKELLRKNINDSYYGILYTRSAAKPDNSLQ